MSFIGKQINLKLFHLLGTVVLSWGGAGDIGGWTDAVGTGDILGGAGAGAGTGTVGGAGKVKLFLDFIAVWYFASAVTNLAFALFNSFVAVFSFVFEALTFVWHLLQFSLFLDRLGWPMHRFRLGLRYSSILL